MSENKNVGSGWDYMFSAIVNSLKTKNFSLLDGCNELEAMQKVLDIPEIR